MDTLQVLGTVLISVVAVLVFILKLIVPWMKCKIDQKNGSIGELVGEVKGLSEAICTLVAQAGERQEAFLTEVRTAITLKDTQIERLTEQVEKLTAQIREALDRAA